MAPLVKDKSTVMEKTKILLVDDRPDGLLALEVVLRRPDYEFIKARSGEEALRILLDNHEDLAAILMDVQMPEMDGFETAAFIKKEERYKHVPIIFVTGIHGDPRFVTQGYEVGAIDYVTKPYQPYILQSKVSVLADLHRKTKLIAKMQEEEHRRDLEETQRVLEESRNFASRTERALQESEQRFRILTSCAPVGIFFTDSKGRCQFVNQVWQELSGQTEQEALAKNGWGWADSIHEDDRKEVAKNWKVALENEKEFSAQYRYHTSASRITWVQTKIIPLRSDEGKIIGFIGSCVDVTERVKSEEALRSAAEALTRTNDELQRFAWVASHDLKEPLRMVASYVKLLERNYRGKLDKNADEYISYAVQGATRMYSLVDGIMSLSGIDRCAQQPRTVDCNSIFDTAVASLQVSIKENNASVTRGDLPVVLGDPSQIGQLFQNLIANSIKFRREADPIVHVDATERDDDWLFTVKDNGIGIDPQYSEKIFGIFQRLHSKDQFPGSGVGLAICKKIVERHRGRIWVESIPAEGSTFHFSLPAADTETNFALSNLVKPEERQLETSLN